MAAVYRPKLTFPGEYTECVENITRRHWALAPHQDEEKPNDDDGRGQQEKRGFFSCWLRLLLLLLFSVAATLEWRWGQTNPKDSRSCFYAYILLIFLVVGGCSIRSSTYPIWWKRLLISLIKGIYINLYRSIEKKDSAITSVLSRRARVPRLFSSHSIERIKGDEDIVV
jgi:hypothetical protein